MYGHPIIFLDILCIYHNQRLHRQHFYDVQFLGLEN